MILNAHAKLEQHTAMGVQLSPLITSFFELLTQAVEEIYYKPSSSQEERENLQQEQDKGAFSENDRSQSIARPLRSGEPSTSTVNRNLPSQRDSVNNHSDGVAARESISDRDGVDDALQRF